MLREKLPCELVMAVSHETGSSSTLNKIANHAYKARWLALWKSERPTTSDLEPYLNQFGSSHHRGARNNQIHENQRIRGDYKMKSGRVYLRVAASWVWLWAQSSRMIFNDSLTGNRTLIRHQLHSLIGLGHVTAGNRSRSRIVITIMWLGTRIVIFLRLAYHKIANSPSCDRPLRMRFSVNFTTASIACICSKWWP